MCLAEQKANKKNPTKTPTKKKQKKEKKSSFPLLEKHKQVTSTTRDPGCVTRGTSAPLARSPRQPSRL